MYGTAPRRAVPYRRAVPQARWHCLQCSGAVHEHRGQGKGALGLPRQIRCVRGGGGPWCRGGRPGGHSLTTVCLERGSQLGSGVHAGEAVARFRSREFLIRRLAACLVPWLVRTGVAGGGGRSPPGAAGRRVSRCLVHPARSHPSSPLALVRAVLRSAGVARAGEGHSASLVRAGRLARPNHEHGREGRFGY